MAVIALAGFQHETNTFAPTKADYAAFLQADAWPKLLLGQEILDTLQDHNIPMCGFIQAAAHHTLRPIVWANATPSGLVTADAFERICDFILKGLQSIANLDAVYLDLHGAMVTESYDDGEGEILRRVRELVGPHILIVASLDFHANVTRLMVESSDYLTGYRTYPHVDMAFTGARTAEYLDYLLMRREPMQKRFWQIPFLISPPWQCTDLSPMKELFALRERISQMPNDLSFFPGFPLADIYDAGASIVAYGEVSEEIDALGEKFYQAVIAQKSSFHGKLYSAADAVSYAQTHLGSKPIILADTCDNPGCGSDSNESEIIDELIAKNVHAVSLLHFDPSVAALAHEAGIGKTLETKIGTQQQTHPYKVMALTESHFMGSGPFYLNCEIDLGKVALLQHNQVRVIVSSRKAQAADQAMLACVGLNASQESIIALKSTVHFRADFAPIAAEILVVAAKGSNPADLSALCYKKQRFSKR